MNKVIKKLFVGRHPELTYKACGSFINIKFKIQTYQNELGKTCFQHDMAYEISKIYLVGWYLTKCYLIKHLLLPKTKTIDIEEVVLQWFMYIFW